MRAGEALAAAAAAGVAPREARLLLARTLDCSEASLMAHPGRELPEAVERRFTDRASRRARGEPVAYLLGEREFFSLTLEVGPAVLIPRPETELLVEATLAHLTQPAAVLDLGTGSGAIALALKQACPAARVVAVDASAAALEVARHNAARHGLEVDFREGDWFAPVAGERFDLVVSNPPYIAEGDPHFGHADLRHEPRAALASGVDGLDALRAIIGAAPAHLRPGGRLLLEHGMGQDGAVRVLLARAGFGTLTSLADGAGIARVAAGRVKS
ncbi:MAG TPA: peptide chain release factor N(5)-glutamine methyltransferase [Burkholderiales bacterium]